MNAKFELEIADQNIVVTAFKTPGGTNELFERIAQEARSHVPDVSTKKGRDQIGSLALKISKSKTFIEKCGKELVAEQKAQIKVIDDDRIATVKKFDELRNEILAPRDAWERAEKDRIKKHEDAIESIKNNACYYIDTALAELKQSLAFAEQVIVDESFEEYQEQAKIAKYEAIELLRAAVANREKYEAEQAELERLRLAEQARLQREHEDRIAREATEKATREAEEKARFESERVQRERAESEQREARLKAEKEAAELRAVQAAENERKRIEAEQAAKAEAARKAEEARLADVEHSQQVHREAFNGIQALCLGIPEAQIKDLILAIRDGKVPHVSIKY